MAERDLLFEIGVEELPAGACESAVKQLIEKAPNLLVETGVPHGKIKVMATPRRLVVLVKNVKAEGEATTVMVKGPARAVAYDGAGRITQAVVGFAKSQGVDPKQLVIRTEGKGEYVFAIKKKPAPKAVEVLPGALRKLAMSLEFDKSMRWAGYETRFARPVRWIVALLGDTKLPIEFEMIDAGTVTYGPRNLNSKPITVKNPADYLTKIAKAGIVLDHIERRKLIAKKIDEAAKITGGRVADTKVLQEVDFLVETPNAIVGTFDDTFLKLPRCVTVTAMESHQRYFPIENDKGKLLPRFIVVHNGPVDSADLIRSGHERVIRARLADALFFFDEDGKKTLADRVADLKGIVFQDKLGTVFEKTKRIKKLAAEIADQLDYADDEVAETERAAELAKADLTTSMVREFPDLQGVIGEEYARNEGHPKAVSCAISEHYLPRNFGDKLPATKTGIAVSIADKLDTIVGCFAIGLIPTGSEDPYALRRQGQAIVSVILDKGSPLELEPLIAKAFFLYERQKVKTRSAGDVFADIETFFRGRLKFHFTSKGYRYDVADAVLEGELNDLAALESTARVLNGLIGAKVLDDVLTGFERCHNLSKAAKDGHVDATRFTHPSEGKLLAAAESGEAAYEKYLETGNVLAYMKALANMRPAIDKYFDDVLVMDKDEKIRANRLSLLKKTTRLYLAVADFSKIIRIGE
ncbi:MAG: glycine--tRNA ligase subunit beta [Actinomycetota bacterium]